MSYLDRRGHAERLLSQPTPPVADVNDALTGTPRIDGKTTEKQTLTVDTAGIADADGLGALSFQWLRDGIAIEGAAADRYTLGRADVGKSVSVRVSYIDGHGNLEQTVAGASGNVLPAGVPTGVSGKLDDLDDDALDAAIFAIRDAIRAGSEDGVLC